jgi:N-glycosylase/DNA lyase
MPQRMFGCFEGKIRELLLPNPEEEVLPGVPWGRFEHFFTPAYWRGQAWLDGESRILSSYKIGETLAEEVAACLLGGHGIPAEIGLAAFATLKKAGLLNHPAVTEQELLEILLQPMAIGDRKLRYRFARQKSTFLAPVLNAIHQNIYLPSSAIELRKYLLGFHGIGYKTASWITRNWLHSSEVAIIDIHIHRAGLACGLFGTHHRVESAYMEMERLFIDFCKKLDVSAALLDALIWRSMKTIGPAVFPMVTRQLRLL